MSTRTPIIAPAVQVTTQIPAPPARALLAVRGGGCIRERGRQTARTCTTRDFWDVVGDDEVHSDMTVQREQHAEG
jgi:hypothetical protein